MDIKKIISNYFSPFSIENKQALQLLFPLERGNVNVEIVSKKEVQASITSYFNFNVGEITSTASSDYPSKIKFYSYPGQIFPNFSFGTTVYNDDCRPFKVKSAYHGDKRNLLFSQGINVTFKVLPSSADALDRSFIGIKAKTDVCNKDRNKFFAFEFKSDKSKLKFEGLLYNYIKQRYMVQTGINYSFRNYTIKSSRLNLFSTTNLGKTEASAVYFLRNSSLNFIFRRNMDDFILNVYNYYISTFKYKKSKKNKGKKKEEKKEKKIKVPKFLFKRNNDLCIKNINSGILFGINNLGRSSFGPKFLGKMFTKFDFDKDSSFHFIYGLNGECSAKFCVSYQNFINFEFSLSSAKPVSSNSQRENKYGAVITFDLCDRNMKLH